MVPSANLDVAKEALSLAGDVTDIVSKLAWLAPLLCGVSALVLG